MKSHSLSHLLPNEQAAVFDYVARIHDHFPNRILSTALFGSKARGDGDTESDIDLLVLVDAEDLQVRSELWRIASDVSLEYNVVISARVFGQTRWAETRRIQLPLYRAIEEDAIPLTSESSPA